MQVTPVVGVTLVTVQGLPAKLTLSVERVKADSGVAKNPKVNPVAVYVNDYNVTVLDACT